MAAKERARYDGPHDSVGLPDVIGPDGLVTIVERGNLLPEWVSVPIRDALLEQEDVWTRVKTPGPQSTPAPAAPADPSEE